MLAPAVDYIRGVKAHTVHMTPSRGHRLGEFPVETSVVLVEPDGRPHRSADSLRLLRRIERLPLRGAEICKCIVNCTKQHVILSLQIGQGGRPACRAFNCGRMVLQRALSTSPHRRRGSAPSTPRGGEGGVAVGGGRRGGRAALRVREAGGGGGRRRGGRCTRSGGSRGDACVGVCWGMTNGGLLRRRGLGAGALAEPRCLSSSSSSWGVALGGPGGGRPAGRVTLRRPSPARGVALGGAGGGRPAGRVTLRRRSLDRVSLWCPCPRGVARGVALGGPSGVALRRWPSLYRVWRAACRTALYGVCYRRSSRGLTSVRLRIPPGTALWRWVLCWGLPRRRMALRGILPGLALRRGILSRLTRGILSRLTRGVGLPRRIPILDALVEVFTRLYRPSKYLHIF
eukprot:Hpha_TRINITY_DN13468_c0_g2::TRINITY_DN13468_c0_g2_i1::g.130921::m.130921